MKPDYYSQYSKIENYDSSKRNKPNSKEKRSIIASGRQGKKRKVEGKANVESQGYYLQLRKPFWKVDILLKAVGTSLRGYKCVENV